MITALVISYNDTIKRKNFLVMRTQDSHISYNSVNYSYHVVHEISSTYLSYNWKFVPFGHLFPSPPPPISHLW